MICRELQADDVLPWTIDEIGWNPAQLDPETVWIAFDQKSQKIVGMVIAAEVHRTLLILRILGSGGAWVRPLWRHIRLVCFHRHVSSFWTFADNDGDDQARLLQLVQKDGSTYATWRPESAIVIAGRWNAPIGSISADSYGSGRSGNAGGDGVRTGEPAWFQFRFGRGAGSSAAEATAGSHDRAAENGLPGSAAERPGLDGRESDFERLQHSRSDPGGSSIRSKLYREIFGTDPTRQ